MDTLVPLFTTTEGRISRKQWWIGTAVLVVAIIILTLLLGMVGLGATATSSGWGSFIVGLLALYPSYCLSIKRRQDRDNNGLDLKILLAASVVLNLIQALGIGITATDIGDGVLIPTPAQWLSILLLLLAAGGLYLLVQLGFLKGTDGQNSYGADPLGYKAIAA